VTVLLANTVWLLYHYTLQWLHGDVLKCKTGKITGK
jgi:hypothetical protein